jgi:hypothetical protein
MFAPKQGIALIGGRPLPAGGFSRQQAVWFVTRAFSSEVEAGSHQENAPK